MSKQLLTPPEAPDKLEEDSASQRYVNRSIIPLSVIVALVALIISLMFSGASAPTLLGDPGPFVRWALPVFNLISYVGMAVVISALTFACFMVPFYRPGYKFSKKTYHLWQILKLKAKNPEKAHKISEKRKKKVYDDENNLNTLYLKCLKIASIAGMAWSIGAVGTLILGYASAAGSEPRTDMDYTSELGYYILNISQGQAWSLVCLIAMVVTVLSVCIRSIDWAIFALGISLVGIIPLAVIGHGAGGDDHTTAVNALGLHILGMSWWMGGIAVLIFLSNLLKNDTYEVLQRYSKLALMSFILVVFSGVISASIRIQTWEDIFSVYGILVIVKVILSVFLGFIGFAHRQWVIPKLNIKAARYTSRRVLWQFISVEFIIMAIIAGVAVTLSRTAPPSDENLPEGAGPSRILTGYDLPPELESYRLFTEWRVDWIWVAVIALLIFSYLRGVYLLKKRGISWSILRTVSWLIGNLVLFYITSGGIAVYGQILFSIHMIDHMALTMIAPFFLVLGSPITLLLKTLHPRLDGSRGIREWVLALTNSTFSAVITNPVVAAINFAGSLIFFYHAGILYPAMYYHVGHEWMYFHFLLTGYIFMLTMIGSDPLPHRASYPVRLVILIATMGFHAFFGIGLMMSNGLLAPDWFGNMGRPWGESAIDDQRTGGAIAWSIGEIPTMILAVVVAVEWSLSDKKEAKRVDRNAERTRDAELAAYNDMLAQMTARQDKEDSH